MPFRGVETLLTADDSDDDDIIDDDDADIDLLKKRDRINQKNGIGRQKPNNASTSSSPIDANRLCYCTDGVEACGRGNNTCVKHANAACFHSIHEEYNIETRQMETWHRFGCAHLDLEIESGAEASYLTCKSYLTPHARPSSIACCYEGDYCNQHIEPPPYVNIPSRANHTSGSMSRNITPLIACASIGFVMSMLVILALGYFLYRCYRYHITGKWSWKSKLSRTMAGITQSDHHFYGIDEKTKMMTDFEPSSGSGAGEAVLVQRTIGLDLMRYDLVGKGRYGEVWRANYRGSMVAVKIFYTTEEHSWKNEARVYQTPLVSNKNILRFVASDIQSIQSVTQLLLITEYHEFGSLHDYLRREQTLHAREALMLAHSAVSGIEHLHLAMKGTGSGCKPEIAHRDIKSKNIIVKAPGVCCIADFGLAVRYFSENEAADSIDQPSKIVYRLEPSPVNIQVGTKRYMAPELLDKTLNIRNFDEFKLADIYSFALVLWELARRIEDGPLVSDGCDTLSSSTSIPTDPAAHSPTPSSLSQQSGEMSTARPYEPPFEGMVESDPSFEEMKKIVCEEKRRPPLDNRWLQGQSVTLQSLANLMQECWNEVPYRRHTSYILKMRLQTLIDNLPDAKCTTIDVTTMMNTAPIGRHHHQLAESGFRSKTQS